MEHSMKNKCTPAYMGSIAIPGKSSEIPTLKRVALKEKPTSTNTVCINLTAFGFDPRADGCGHPFMVYGSETDEASLSLPSSLPSSVRAVEHFGGLFVPEVINYGNGGSIVRQVFSNVVLDRLAVEEVVQDPPYRWRKRLSVW
jgi:hypothetical protein